MTLTLAHGFTGCGRQHDGSLHHHRWTCRRSAARCSQHV